MLVNKIKKWLGDREWESRKELTYWWPTGRHIHSYIVGDSIREHRAKQGRKYWPEKPFSITRKKKIEQLKNRDHETEERASDW